MNGNDPVGERQEGEHNDSQCKETQKVHNLVQTIQENVFVALKTPGCEAAFRRTPRLNFRFFSAPLL